MHATFTGYWGCFFFYKIVSPLLIFILSTEKGNAAKVISDLSLFLDLRLLWKQGPVDKLIFYFATAPGTTMKMWFYMGGGLHLKVQ